MKGKILIIEDEVKIARFLELELNYEGYEAFKVHDGREGLTKAREGEFDLILLDIMLPSMNGIEVLRRFRETSETPVIMLTAKDDTMDKVTGLDMGADDYVTKPFEIEELLARIRVALKKKKSEVISNKILKINDLKLDLDKYIVTFKNEIIELTKREFDLLHYLLENKGRVLSREKIVEKVWGYDYIGETRTVDVHISNLRKKIELDESQPVFIKTVRGMGYKFA